MQEDFSDNCCVLRLKEILKDKLSPDAPEDARETEAVGML